MKALISRTHVMMERATRPHRLNRVIKKKGTSPFSDPVCVVDLSCYGDVLHVLPLMKYFSQIGPKPTLIVQPRLADLGKSVNYANVEIATEWTPALMQARMRFKTVFHTQTRVPPGTHDDHDCHYGFMEKVYKNFDPYLHELYLDGAFENIEINVRDEKAERALAQRVLGLPCGRPVVLLNYSGISSPFPDGAMLTDAIQKALADTDAQIVDISGTRADKFTDMLALFDRASLLISSDSGLMHLAGAHKKIPYIGLLRDTGLYHHRPTWMSAGRTLGNCIMKLGYTQFGGWIPRLLKVVRGVVAPDRSGRRIIHVHSDHADAKGDTRRRNQLAEVTWKTIYPHGHWTNCPVADSILDRFFNDGNRKLPYVRDVIDFGLPADTRPDDLILFTNADTCISAAMDYLIRTDKVEMAHFHRRDFNAPVVFPLIHSQIPAGSFYSGTDAFLFPFRWWNQNRLSFPDMVISGEAWDAVLREMMIKSGARRVQDFLYHERHESLWSQRHYRYSNSMNLYNLKLAKEKLRSMGIDYRPFGIR